MLNFYDLCSHLSWSKPRFGNVFDPMALRRGGKRLPIEDACYYQWPFLGVEQFGVFGICDGHWGVRAADIASKMLQR
ncbi:hypothetical protein GIB67_028290 [Kingdonia uniflora]|uniref:PPM-type phosphatase domain-containing protein n=1 Tax=Kingdonia uniflora TaxID=39325 RepID=A0A7J7MI41_9MAGN|nr:hypothetical protein GIB67_028290 [Kingdonia uniflora]